MLESVFPPLSHNFRVTRIFQHTHDIVRQISLSHQFSHLINSRKRIKWPISAFLPAVEHKNKKNYHNVVINVNTRNDYLLRSEIKALQQPKKVVNSSKFSTDHKRETLAGVKGLHWKCSWYSLSSMKIGHGIWKCMLVRMPPVARLQSARATWKGNQKKKYYWIKKITSPYKIENRRVTR